MRTYFLERKSNAANGNNDDDECNCKLKLKEVIYDSECWVDKWSENIYELSKR